MREYSEIKLKMAPAVPIRMPRTKSSVNVMERNVSKTRKYSL